MEEPLDNNSEQNNNENTPIAVNPRQKNNITNEKRMCLIRAVCDYGMSIKQAADTFDIGYENAKKIINIFKKESASKKKKSECSPVILTESILNKIKNYISENPALTLRKVKNKLVQSEPAGFNISISQ
ncbi:hypothetical protein CDIK_2906 [Cucumispora dikerogammari]|nr:hypothetical protein CDIK_2906 [Cucumispora dikerogammari]